MSVAKNMVDQLIADISDRNGLGNEWEAIDTDIQDEIREAWIQIVSANLDPEQNVVMDLLAELQTAQEESVSRSAVNIVKIEELMRNLYKKQAN